MGGDDGSARSFGAPSARAVIVVGLHETHIRLSEHLFGQTARGANDTGCRARRRDFFESGCMPFGAAPHRRARRARTSDRTSHDHTNHRCAHHVHTISAKPRFARAHVRRHESQRKKEHSPSPPIHTAHPATRAASPPDPRRIPPDPHSPPSDPHSPPPDPHSPPSDPHSPPSDRRRRLPPNPHGPSPDPRHTPPDRHRSRCWQRRCSPQRWRAAAAARAAGRRRTQPGPRKTRRPVSRGRCSQPTWRHGASRWWTSRDGALR